MLITNLRIPQNARAVKTNAFGCVAHERAARLGPVALTRGHNVGNNTPDFG